MRTIIDEYIDNESNSGLLLLTMPTGFGKTHNVIRSMFDKVKTLDKGQKIFFVTTLIKNLPDKELRRVYAENGRAQDFDKEVLIIKSNLDYALENILKVEVPEEFRNNAYNNLFDAVNEYDLLKKQKSSTIGTVKTKLMDIIREDYEPAFRKQIVKIIRENMPRGVGERKKLIRTERRYHWIGELYPTVFTSDYNIYMMSMNKLLVRNTVLVEPSYYFINHSLMEKAIVFIDEFDATKATMQNTIIKTAVDSKADYIELFIQIYHALGNHEISGALRGAYNQSIQNKERNSENHITLEELIKDAERINKDFLLMHCYKTRRDEISRGQNFLFNDSSYHTILRNNKKYIRVTPNLEEENNVEIIFEDHDNYYKNRRDIDFNIFALIRNINGFLTMYKFMVLSWASCYCEIENSRRNAEDNEFVIENAIKTIYIEFGLKEEDIKLLMADLSGSSKSRKEDSEVFLPDMTFYNNGYKYYEFMDNDEHLTKTKFEYVQLVDTPEKILLQICQKSKVLGISATADINSVIGNYDIKYIMDSLGTTFFVPNSEYIAQIEDDFDRRMKKYQNGEIKVSINILDKDKACLTIEERLSEIFENDEFIYKYINMLGISSGDNHYQKQRYCTIFSAIKEFVKQEDIQSFLCMNMPHTKRGKAAFDLNIFEAAFEDLIELFNKTDKLDVKNSLVILKGEEYEDTKDQLIKNLGNGRKIFVMSSYQTVGAGQNLHYPIPEGKECITIFDGDTNRQLYKDFDAIYLGDVTNIITNLDSELFEKVKQEDLLQYLFQVEYLYQNDEISFATLKKLIRRGFKKYTGESFVDNSYKDVIRKVNRSQSAKLQITKDIIQAIGRICRTFYKNPNIYIYTNEELLSKIEIGNVNEKLLNPEVLALFEARRNLKSTIEPEDEKLCNYAERIALSGKNYIMRMLSRDWTIEAIRLWGELRNTVMMYPTADLETYQTNNIIHNFFLKFRVTANKYLYAQSGDFSEVVISFDGDRAAFENDERCEFMSISEVSIQESRLNRILRYPGMKKYFEDNRYATEFVENEYMMSPVLFQNIYKGAIGENAGKFILKQELGIELKEIEDPEKFEYFDFEIAAGVYVDFKHWKQSYTQDGEKTRNEVRRKLNKIGGKKVYIINILDEHSDKHKINKAVDDRIIEIPCLLNEDGSANLEAISELKEVLHHDK